MGPRALLFAATTVVAFGVLYQLILHNLIFITLGVGRKHQKIEEFPYTCRLVESPLLESCEDLVVDEAGRRLYAACRSVESFMGWSPGGGLFNISARTLKDHISVLDLDSPGQDGLYNLHTLTITGNFQSPTNDKAIDLHAIDIETISPTRLRFFLNNHRPAVNENGEFLDPKKVGDNATIEIFEHEKGSRELEFVRTVADKVVRTPNSVIGDGEGGAWVSNDSDQKIHLFPILNFLVGSGSVTHCPSDPSKPCTESDIPFNFANGLVRINQTLYVANSATSIISVLHIHENNTVSLIENIQIPMPIDNLSLNGKGEIYVAGIPDAWGFMASMEDPKRKVGATVFKIRREGEAGRVKHVLEKILEDIEGRVLLAATVAVSDSKRGTIWLSGNTARGLVVCEPIEVKEERVFVKRGGEGDCLACEEKGKERLKVEL